MMIGRLAIGVLLAGIALGEDLSMAIQHAYWYYDDLRLFRRITKITPDLGDSEPPEVSFDPIGFSQAFRDSSGSTHKSPAEERLNFHLSYISSYFL